MRLTVTSELQTFGQNNCTTCSAVAFPSPQETDAVKTARTFTLT